MSDLATILRRLSVNRSGSINVMFAICSTALAIAAGGAYDVSEGFSLKRRLSEAADAAALAAVSASSVASATANGAVNTSALASIGSNVFLSNVGESGASLSPSVNVAVSNNNGQFHSHVTYVASYVPSLFGAFTGSFDLVGSADADNGTSLGYARLYFAIDTSQSMGIAATPGGISALSGLTGGCAFGCHVTTVTGRKSFEQIANDNQITLRIDVLRTAVAGVVDRLIQNSSSPSASNYSVGVYAINKQMSQQAPITNNLVNLRSAIGTSSQFYNYGLSGNIITSAGSAIDLADVALKADGTGDRGDAQTAFDVSLTGLASIIVGPNGDGQSVTHPTNIVFIITDGIGDQIIAGKRVYSAFDSTLCNQLKAKALVAVLYTNYYPVADPGFNKNVAPLLPSVAANLQSCASSGLFFDLRSYSDLVSAVDAMVKATMPASVRLSA